MRQFLKMLISNIYSDIIEKDNLENIDTNKAFLEIIDKEIF